MTKIILLLTVVLVVALGIGGVLYARLHLVGLAPGFVVWSSSPQKILKQFDMKRFEQALREVGYFDAANRPKWLFLELNNTIPGDGNFALVQASNYQDKQTRRFACEKGQTVTQGLTKMPLYFQINNFDREVTAEGNRSLNGGIVVCVMSLSQPGESNNAQFIQRISSLYDQKDDYVFTSLNRP